MNTRLCVEAIAERWDLIDKGFRGGKNIKTDFCKEAV
jgi:hypothetical protein